MFGPPKSPKWAPEKYTTYYDGTRYEDRFVDILALKHGGNAGTTTKSGPILYIRQYYFKLLVGIFGPPKWQNLPPEKEKEHAGFFCLSRTIFDK